MTRDEVKALYERVVRVLARRGIEVDKRATPADLARAAADKGETRVRTFIEGCYYPLIYGDGQTTLGDGDAEDLVREIEGPVVVDRRSVRVDTNEGADTSPAPSPEPTPSTLAPSPAQSSEGVRGSSLQRNVGATVGYSILAAGLVAVTVAMASSGETLWQPALAAFFALGAVLLAATAFRGVCPRCAVALDVSVGMGNEGITLCFQCDDYFRVEAGQLVPIVPGFIAREPEFEIRWDKAPPPSEWTWPWPDRCVVCGGPPHASALAVWNPGEKYGLPGGTRLSIPTCEEHVRGMMVLYPFLKFRSYDHWLAFRAANGIGA